MEAISSVTSTVEEAVEVLFSIEEARRIAADPSADPDFLTQLAFSSDRLIRQIVTANPNTPLRALFYLGAEFPERLLDNPILQLLFLENPNFIETIPPLTLAHMLPIEGIPIFIIDWAVKQQHQRQLLEGSALNHRTPVSLLNIIFKGIYQSDRIFWDLPLQSSRRTVFLALAINPNTPSEDLAKLLSTPHPDIAESYRLHINIAGEMTSAWDRAATEAILCTSFLEAKQIKISRKLSPHSKDNLGGHSIDESRLKELAEDKNPVRRYRVARYSNTPASLLERLSEDAFDDIRLAVIRNPNTPIHMIEKLIGDRAISVRKAARQIAIYWYFTYRPDAFCVSLLPPTWKENFIDNLNPVMRFCLFHHSDTPPKVLAAHCKALEWRDRCAIAKNPNTPISALKILASDGNRVVRYLANAQLKERD